MLKKIHVVILTHSLLCSYLIADTVNLDLVSQRTQRAGERVLDSMQVLADQVGEAVTRNNDEELFVSDRRANFGKSLTWSDSVFHKVEYDKLLTALDSQNSSDFATLTGGATPDPQAFKLVNPQALYAYDFQGADQWLFNILPAPSIQSAEAAGEMVEVYWHALLRDVPFNKYDSASVVTCDGTVHPAHAIADLDALSDYKGPKAGGSVTAATLFRGIWTGDLVGPYISQFLYLPVPIGPTINHDGTGSVSPFDTPAYQEYAAPKCGKDNNFMTDETEFKDIQRGRAPSGSITYDQTRRWPIMTGRDLAEYVHHDSPTQVAMNTATILLGFGPDALDSAMYYQDAGVNNQAGFVTFGATSILTQVAKVVELALKAAWFQKWYVHRRLRPEMFSYLLTQHFNGSLTNTGFHNDILCPQYLWDDFCAYGYTVNALLPMAYQQGSPCHPAYPAGHGTFAGAVATVLKAFFNESYEIPNTVAVQPTTDNDGLETLDTAGYAGAALTIGGELNKLASNISIGRDMAGVHYRSDGTQGMLLGEKVAIKFLQDLGRTYHEAFTGFSLTKFDGTTITGLGAQK